MLSIFKKKVEIFKDNAEILREKSTDVLDAKEAVKICSILKDAFPGSEKCVGLAANQVGIAKKCFYVNFNSFEEFFINTEITGQSKQTQSNMEGCLSLPGLNAFVVRPRFINVRYRDKDFVLKEMEYGNFLACIIQHEFDHTNGIMFIDKVSNGEFKKVRRQLKEREIQAIR